ncbi:Fic family protein [Candidatus Woesearchaeota archaeon]|nr:Fic family protein [Candidatus Woesearchaeota archaeon]
MTYTEVKIKNGNKYYYRVKSVREGARVRKQRKYLGKNLSKQKLGKLEQEADQELMFLKNILTKQEILFLKKIKQDFLKEPRATFENRQEAFCALFTYNSNAIEGNTLTLQETAALLFDQRVPAQKSLREINEALNHKKAFEHILEYKEDITRNFICKLHELVIKDTLKPDLTSQVGRYRTVQVYIRGVEDIPPKPGEVPKEMRNLLSWYSRNKNTIHPLVVAAYFHTGFELIHPFVDGNGRVGRLLMNFILHKNKYPMINIPNKKKLKYYEALHQAQNKGKLRPFIELLLSLLKESRIRF